jgi:hypothetical protein
MEAYLDRLPEQLGTIPQWGMFIALLALLVKQVIPWRQQTLDRDAKFCENLTKEVSDLRAELKQCEQDCTAKSKALHEELFGMRRQHIQEQISLINTIMRSVDSPELLGMIKLLERVEQNLQVTRHNELEHKDDVKRP